MGRDTPASGRSPRPYRPRNTRQLTSEKRYAVPQEQSALGCHLKPNTSLTDARRLKPEYGRHSSPDSARGEWSDAEGQWTGLLAG